MVIEQSYGIWHTKCFDKRSPINGTEIKDICASLGYRNTQNATWHTLDDQLYRNSKRARYNQPPSKVVVGHKYAPIKLNDNFTLKYIRSSRSYGKLEPWEQVDDENCNQVEVNCDGKEY